jgi:hypothetical protein
MAGERIETTLFELAVALQSVCDDDREIVLAMMLCLSPDHRTLLATPSRRLAGALPMRPDVRTHALRRA